MDWFMHGFVNGLVRRLVYRLVNVYISVIMTVIRSLMFFDRLVVPTFSSFSSCFVLGWRGISTDNTTVQGSSKVVRLEDRDGASNNRLLSTQIL